MSTLDVSLAIGAGFRLLALTMLLGNVLPRAWRETHVPNGLGMLRRVIFLGLSILTTINLFTVLINAGRITDILQDDATGILAIVNGVAELFMAGALYLIYNHDYGREKIIKKEGV